MPFPTIHAGALAASLVGALALAPLATPTSAGEVPIVIELFTSQGCSSCPPANANLIEISQRPDVLALSFSVTYWDRLGWKDIFGREEYTNRQRIYEPALGERGPFTPQMVVNGAHSLVGNRLGDVESAVARVAPLDGPSVEIGGGSVVIGAGQVPAGGADVWLVHYDPQTVEVPVGRGENAGRTLPHSHVVHRLERIGAWQGNPVTLALAGAPDGLSTAVLVQTRDGGPLLAAATD